MGRLDQWRRASWKTWKPSGLQGLEGEEEVGRERARGDAGGGDLGPGRVFLFYLLGRRQF